MSVIVFTGRGRKRNWSEIYIKVAVVLIHADIRKIHESRFHRFFTTLFREAALDVQRITGSRMSEKSDAKKISDLRRSIDEQVLSIIHLLIKYKVSIPVNGLVFTAIRYGSLECLKCLLENGVAVNDCDEEENTALHHCFAVDSKFSITSK